jgi:hypothetical protein
MNTDLAQVLQKISDNINPSTGLGHPLDMQKTACWLGETIQTMEKPEHPDDVADHLRKLGRIGDETASEVARVYEALWCYIKGHTPFGG